MKHLLTVLLVAFISLTTVAQDATKEDKAAYKVRKEADLRVLFDSAKVTPEEEAIIREFSKESGEYLKELKADPDFTEEEKILKAKVYSRIKNTRIKELIGDDRYAIYKEVGKKQRDLLKADLASGKLKK